MLSRQSQGGYATKYYHLLRAILGQTAPLDGLWWLVSVPARVSGHCVPLHGVDVPFTASMDAFPHCAPSGLSK